MIFECVKCGYCCTVRPCAYGEWDEEKGQCKFLTKDNLCSKYEEIKKAEFKCMYPMFGCGCSSSLFNERREAKIAAMAMKPKEITINQEQKEILDHTMHRAANGLYCGDSEDMQDLVKKGLMVSAGKKSFVPDEYFKITEKGRKVFSGQEN